MMVMKNPFWTDASDVALKKSSTNLIALLKGRGGPTTDYGDNCQYASYFVLNQDTGVVMQRMKFLWKSWSAYQSGYIYFEDGDGIQKLLTPNNYGDNSNNLNNVIIQYRFDT